MQSTRTYYALRVKASGALARVRHEMTECRRAHYLSPDAGYPVFEAPTAEAASFVLFGNTRDAQSSAECPGWGEYDGAELEVVLVEESTSVTPVVVRAPLEIRIREKRRMAHRVAALYTRDRPLPAGESVVLFWLVTLPEGMTADAAREWEDQVVYPKDDKYGGHRLLRSLPVPADYADIMAGASDALFLVEEACLPR